MTAVASIASRPTPEIDVRKDAAPGDAKHERSFWQRAFGDDGVSFSTLLDVINPLQHIPVVSTIYREVTGDTIAPGAKLIGDTLFGGPIGLALSAVDVTVQGETGKDIGEHVVAMLKPADAPAPAGETAIAAADADEKTRADSAAPDAAPVDTAQKKSDAPASDTKPAEIAANIPKPKATPAVDPMAYAPRSAFVAAAMKPRAPGQGVGGAFVPLETRSTIAPPSMFAPVSLAMPAPRDELTKSADKSAPATNLPDAKAVAANPGMLKSLRANGVRPTPTHTASGPSVSVPMPPPLAPVAAPSDASGAPNEFADVMARNLERYMALRNRRPAPAKVDAAY